MSQSVCDRGIALVREQIVKTWRLRQDTACAGKIVRSAGLDVTPAFRVRLWWVTSCSRCPGKWPASLCAAATPVPSSVQRWDWSATQDRCTPVLSESPWRRSTAGHHARRLIVSAAWGSAVAMQPSTWWRRYVAFISGNSRRVRPAAWKSWRVQRACRSGWRAVAGPWQQSQSAAISSYGRSLSCRHQSPAERACRRTTACCLLPTCLRIQCNAYVIMWSVWYKWTSEH